MVCKKRFWKRIFSWVSIFSILLNSVLPYGLVSSVYAQEFAASTTLSTKAITAFTVPEQTGETVIDEVNYAIGITVPFGTDVTFLIPTITITGTSVSPGSGDIQDFTNPVTYTVFAEEGITQDYVVTVTITPDSVATVFDEISDNLDSNGVASNLSDVTSENVNNFTGLYFEKYDENGMPFGRLTFANELDLADTETQTFLQNLGDHLDQGNGRIALDVSTATAFADKGATLEMYDMPAVTQENLIVRDDSENILDRSDIVSGFSYDEGTGTVSFNAAHFTQFDIDTTPPEIEFHDDVTTEATSESGAVVDYTAPQATDNIDAPAAASCDPVSGSTFVLGPTTVTCNKTDAAGNAAIPTTFTVTVSDTITLSTPGTPTTTSPTNDTTPTWSWTAASDAVGIDHYIFYWDTVSGGETNSSNSLSPATVNFTHSSVLGSGTWYGKVRAYDANGNSTESAVGSVVIDTEVPVGNIAINSGATYTKSNNVTLNFSGVSADVTSMELGNGASGSYQSSIAYENPHAYILPSNGDGTYTVRVRFTDSAGNVNTGTISDTIILDKTNPTDPADVHSTSHTVNVPTTVNSIDMIWTAAGSAPGATDVGSGVDGYSYSFTQGATDVPDTTKDAEETATTTSSSALAEGSWYFHLRTLDTAGNWTSTVHIGPFIIDTTKPIIASHDDVTAEATSESGAVVTYTLPTATDNVDAPADASCTPVSGSTFVIGTTTVTCTKSDAAGNAATPTTFTVTVTANTPPSFDAILDQSVSEDVSSQNIVITNISPGSDNESGQTVTLSVTSSDTSIVPSPSISGSGSTRTLTYTPAANKYGSVTITVTADDGQTLFNTFSRTFTITVNSVNDAPTFDPISNQTVDEDSSSQNIPITNVSPGPADEASQTVAISATSSNTSIIPDPSVSGAGSTRTLTYTPVENANGTATITVVANDSQSQNNTFSRTFSITVNPVNDAPVVTDSSVSATEETPVVISLSGTDVDGNTLAYSAVSDPSHGTLSAVTGNQITYTPNASYLGTDSFTFKANDGVGDSNTATITITIQDITSPTVTKLGDGSIDVALLAGTTNLVFSEPLSTDSKTAVQNALTAGADKTLTYSWTGEALTITAAETTTFANDVVVSVTDLAGNTATNLLIVDSSLAATQTTPDSGGSATADSDTPEVVISNPDQEVTVTVDGTTDATIDLSSLVDNGTGNIPQITINSGAADIAIPATTVTGPADWNGVIAAPTVTTVTLPETSGETKTLSTAIEIGFADAKLSFDNAVRIVLPGQAGKRAGYTRPGTEFTEITNTCSGDSQVVGDALAADGECKIDIGADLVIWTKHFTKFASYTQTTNSSSNSSSSSSSSGSSAPVCNDTAPAGVPTLLQITPGLNSATLTWSEGIGPLSYYLVTFGTSAGAQTYGNPNIGGAGTTSYTVNSLSGGTRYYFRVRAGNGCAPGGFSNEISVVPFGELTQDVPDGFAENVLGVQTPSESPSPSPTSQSEQVLGSEKTGKNWKIWLWGLAPVSLLFLLWLILAKKRKKAEG